MTSPLHGVSKFSPLVGLEPGCSLLGAMHANHLATVPTTWLTNCQGFALTVKELTILSKGKNEKYGNVKEKLQEKYNCQGIKINV